jgi:hypothetical protein
MQIKKLVLVAEVLLLLVLTIQTKLAVLVGLELEIQ